jgi:hypothetical protein
MIIERIRKQARDNIKKAIKESSESQNKIGEKNGILKSNLSAYLSGKNCISDMKLTSLMMYLKIH